MRLYLALFLERLVLQFQVTFNVQFSLLLNAVGPQTRLLDFRGSVLRCSCWLHKGKYSL